VAKVERAVEKVECPRCRYDLRGVPATWIDSCPVEGVCSECGLEHLWRDVLVPRFATPTWCIEYGQGTKGMFKSFLQTSAMILRPSRFWGELRMSHPIHAKRLVVVLLIVPLVAYVVLALNVGWMTSQSNPGMANRTFPRVATAFLHGTIAPWSARNATTGVSPKWHAVKYRFSMLSNSLRAIRTGIDDWPTGNRDWLFSYRSLQGILTVIACPLMFAALPISRRRAKVHWEHIFRVGMYGLVFTLIPITFDILSQFGIVVRRSHAILAAAIMSALLFVVLSWWWGVATSRYLRMPHAWLVGPSVVVMGYLFQWLLLASIDLSIDMVDLL